MIYDDHSMIMSCMSQVTGAVCTWEPAFRCLSYGECTLQLWHPCATARAAVLNGHTNLISKAEALRVWNMLGCWMVLTHGWPESSWFGILFGTKFEPFGRSLQVSWDRELALSWADDSTLKLWDLKAGGVFGRKHVTNVLGINKKSVIMREKMLQICCKKIGSQGLLAISVIFFYETWCKTSTTRWVNLCCQQGRAVLEVSSCPLTHFPGLL